MTGCLQKFWDDHNKEVARMLCPHDWQPDPDARPMAFNAYVALCRKCGKREIHKRPMSPEADAEIRRNLEKLKSNVT